MIAISVLAILVVIWWGTSTLVSRVFEADLRRVSLLHEAEYTNKLASIGRLAAGRGPRDKQPGGHHQREGGADE